MTVKIVTSWIQDNQVETGCIAEKLEADGQLVNRARHDSQAFVALYRQHYEAIFRYCVHRLFDRTAAEDMTAAVFSRALEKLPLYRGGDEGFIRWLYRLATNQINDALRQKNRQQRLMEDLAHHYDNCHTPDDAGEELTQHRIVRLRQALLSLKPHYQTVITLRFFEKKKSTEMADILGCSDGTVRSQLVRALDQLRKQMIKLDKKGNAGERHV